MKKSKKKKIILLSAALLLALLLVLAFRCDIKVVSYNIETDKIADKIRIAFVADLHSCNYGEGQKDIISILKSEAPDLVLLGGDIVDDHLPQQKAMEFMSAVSIDIRVTMYRAITSSGAERSMTSKLQLRLAV